MSQKADLILTNAAVFTADPAAPSAEAVAIQGRRILFVGSSAEAKNWQGSATRMIDAVGATLMPGFIDSHYHLYYGALDMDRIPLEDVRSFEELAETLQVYAAAHPEREWLAGAALRYNLGPKHGPLTRLHLDGICAERPIYINAYDGHTSWANTKALEQSGLLRGGACGPNSEIVMGADGLASGELREPGAYKPVSDLVPKPDLAAKRRLLREALRQMAAAGITSVHNMNGGTEEAGLYSELLATDELSCRIYFPYSVSPETPLEALEKEGLALKHSLTGDILRAGSVKFFIDGVIESYTGLLSTPYADDESTCGAANYEQEHYQRLVAEADRLGLQVFTHAVGDLGVRWALDAYEAARRASGNWDARHRIEHIELLHPVDLARFQELGVIASMQPLHAPPRVDDGDIWPSRVGRERWPLSFAWQTLREAGACLAFGSDWPVVTFNPLRGLSNAINRLPWEAGMPHQRQSLADALCSYTRDGAYAEHQEKHKGQIKAGYLADLVLFDRDLFRTPREEIGGLRPALTVMDGRIVHEA